MKKAPRKRKTEKSREESKYLRAVGSRISEYAAKRQVSIERLAYEGGVSKGYLYDIVKEEGNPSLLILIRIASALEVAPSVLLK